jgi:hypothetical protein
MGPSTKEIAMSDWLLPADEMLPVMLFIAIVVSAYTVFRTGCAEWRGVWRILAIVPIAIMITVPVNIMVGTTIDPTSHNLAPFEFIFYCVPSFIFWAIIVMLHSKFSKKYTPEK